MTSCRRLLAFAWRRNLLNFNPDDLAQFYTEDGPERVGFVLKDGTFVEVENKAAYDPEAPRFEVAPEVMIEHAETAQATWHTHPGQSGNLSIDDYWAFKNWPQFVHYIVGNDGVWMFRVDDTGKVLRS